MSEAALQRSVVAFLKVAAPDLIFFHPANGGSRHALEAKNLKDQGVLAGVPDLVFTLPNATSAYIELKTPTGRLQPSQRHFMDRCANNPTPVLHAVCRSVDEVAATLRGWGVNLRARGE